MQTQDETNEPGQRGGSLAGLKVIEFAGVGPTQLPPRRPGADTEALLPRWAIDAVTVDKLRALKALQ